MQPEKSLLLVFWDSQSTPRISGIPVLCNRPQNGCQLSGNISGLLHKNSQNFRSNLGLGILTFRLHKIGSAPKILGVNWEDFS